MESMDRNIREIYAEAIVRIDPHAPLPLSNEELRRYLENVSRSKRQSVNCRIARKALKDANYARIKN